MRTSVITTVSVICLLGWAFATVRHMDRTTAKPVRDLSRMMSVRVTVAGALVSHYQQHTNYPRTLSELPLRTLLWGDEGSSPRDVDDWHYRSEGAGFSMAWTNTRGAELFLGGRTGQVYFSREERR